ncbi:unnamed protein product [Callosobruchus maculatus]|uniref:Uncharacterized protein n=1 Tax=Callosobruchus maculatus TaxID=64391 RepID=A0A653DSQ2_CALMS|nr:unnamed protein product [Callosobruchus maculatus]
MSLNIVTMFQISAAYNCLVPGTKSFPSNAPMHLFTKA